MSEHLPDLDAGQLAQMVTGILVSTIVSWVVWARDQGTIAILQFWTVLEDALLEVGAGFKMAVMLGLDGLVAASLALEGALVDVSASLGILAAPLIGVGSALLVVLLRRLISSYLTGGLL